MRSPATSSLPLRKVTTNVCCEAVPHCSRCCLRLYFRLLNLEMRGVGRPSNAPRIIRGHDVSVSARNFLFKLPSDTRTCPFISSLIAGSPERAKGATTALRRCGCAWSLYFRTPISSFQSSKPPGWRHRQSLCLQGFTSNCLRKPQRLCHLDLKLRGSLHHRIAQATST